MKTEMKAVCLRVAHSISYVYQTDVTFQNVLGALIWNPQEVPFGIPPYRFAAMIVQAYRQACDSVQPSK